MFVESCMPGGLLDDRGLTGCKSSRRLIFTLAAFNAWSLLLTLCLGHIKIRQRNPMTLFIKKDKQWSAWSSIFFTTLHPISMIVSSLTIRVNGFRPSLILTFAIWTMRPRMFGSFICWLLASIVGRLRGSGGNRNPYLWTLKDDVVEDALLSIFSLPFALFFIVSHHWVQRHGDDGFCTNSIHYKRFWLSFYLVAAAGVVSCLLMVYMVAHYGVRCFRKKNPSSEDGSKSSRFWTWMLWLSGANMLLAFSGQWLLWGTFLYNADLSWCPGSLIGESVAWALALLLIAVGRPMVGGPYQG